jgi:hypothetical protein
LKIVLVVVLVLEKRPFDEKPTIDSGNESIVATNALVIDRGDMNRSCPLSLENAVFKGAAGARHLHTTGGGTPSSRIARLKAFLARKKRRSHYLHATRRFSKGPESFL